MYNTEEVLETSLQYFDNDKLAANVFMTKYALKDKDGNFLEKSPEDMHWRLAKEFARIEKKYGGPSALSEKEIFAQLDKFKKIVPQGSPMYGIGNSKPVSLSNCVVVSSPDDCMSSIMDRAKELANLYKARAGVGIDISTLRPDGATVNNAAGTSSGAWSFADLYSYVTRMVGQAGRRGALMITMDVRHPDIEKFISMKSDLNKVTGANVSIKIRDDFMKAVENNDEYILKFPVDSADPMFSRVIKAKELWENIIHHATNTAEPGLLFWDTMMKYLPAQCYSDAGFDHCTTNPCGEIILSPYDSCRLISVNLKNFVNHKFTENAKFDFSAFKKTVRMAMRMCDDLVELEIEKLTQILNKVDDQSEKSLWNKLLSACKNGRRTGLGTHGLADMLANLCIPYDSIEAEKIITDVYKTLCFEAYRESVNLAKERGSFPVYDWNKEQNNEFLKKLPNDILSDMKKYGRRGISLLTNAPTGSVSILSQTSSGIEPVFRNYYVRRKKINHNESVDDKNVYVDNVGDRWEEYDVYHHNVREYMEEFKVKKSNLPKFFVTSDTIEWVKRIDSQAALQNFIDHSVSNTINLPKGTSPDVVSKLYFDGWKKGLKGVTVYVDGSRSGVLVEDSKKEDKKFEYRDAPKRPGETKCDIHQVTVKGEKWTILVGLMDNKPYEVFGGLSELIEIPKKYTEGVLFKHPLSTKIKSRYDLKFGEDGIVKDITKVFDNVNYQVHTRMVSLALRHGAKPSFLVEQLLKDPDSDLTSFSRVLSRVLKKYIENGTRVTSDKECGSCGAADALIYQEGCVTCNSCGYSKCS